VFPSLGVTQSAWNFGQMPQAVPKNQNCADSSSSANGSSSTKSSSHKPSNGSRRRSSSTARRLRLYEKARQIVNECEVFPIKDQATATNATQKDACRQTSRHLSERMTAFLQEHDRDAEPDDGKRNKKCDEGTEETRCDLAKGHEPMWGSSTEAGHGSDLASIVTLQPKADCISL